MKSDYYSSPRWSTELVDCSMPMTFDQYSNCSFKCIYCFSQYQRGVGTSKAAYLGHEFRSVNVNAIKKMFLNPEGQFADYIRERKTMQWGGLSDPFDPIEKKKGVGLELLKFFKSIDYPLCFSTKATWWAEDEQYASLFRNQKNWNVKVSIITLEENKSRQVEIGVPTPTERLKALETIAKFDGGGATLRLRPFIIGMSNPSHTELIRLAGKAGAGAVSTEFFCLEGRSKSLKNSLQIFNKVCGMDIAKYYKRQSYTSGYQRLNRDVKRKFVDEMQEATHKAGMRFYVSDAHFKERCDGSSCCGLDEKYFNYCHGQWTEALLEAKKNGKVSWDFISKHLDYTKKVLWRKNHGLNKCSSEKLSKHYDHTFYEYMRWIWNTTSSGQNPWRMYEGILVPKEKDTAGNLIYFFDSLKQ